MTPPTPSRPVRITAETLNSMTFPGYLRHIARREWQHFKEHPYMDDGSVGVQDVWDYWLPDSPERATCVPDDNWEQTKADFADAQRVVERAHATPAAPDLPAEGDLAKAKLGIQFAITALQGVSHDKIPGIVSVLVEAQQLLPAPIPVTAPLPASEGTPRTDGAVVGNYQKLVPGEPKPTEFVLADFARTLEKELVEAKAAQERHLNGGKEWCRVANEALNEIRSLRTLLATAEKERDEATGWMRTLTNDYAVLRGNLRTLLLQNAVPSNMGWTDDNIVEALCARLTPSASQSVEKRAVAVACAKQLLMRVMPDLRSMSTFANVDDALEWRAGVVADEILKHFTTPTQ
jgi:hypothetical protein